MHNFLRICLSTLLLYSSTIFATTWQPIGPGIEYRDLVGSIGLTPWSHIHVFRIDLKKNHMDIALATELSKRHASIDEFATHRTALIALNAGFFDENYRPLGLRIGRQKVHSPLRKISWWGVFYVTHDTPHIASAQDFKPTSAIDFAVQSGPRLLVNGNLLPLKPGYAERSALGITIDNRVIVLVTENTAMTTAQLAELLRSDALHCTQALNLDGGSSSQLFAQIQKFSLRVHGFSNVSDAIIITPKPMH